MKTSFNRETETYNLEVDIRELSHIWQSLALKYDTLTQRMNLYPDNENLKNYFKDRSKEIDDLWQEIDDLLAKSSKELEEE